MEGLKAGMLMGGFGFLRWVPWVYQLLSNSVLGLLPLSYRYFTTMPPARALRTLSLAVLGIGLAWFLVGQGYAYWEEYDHQCELTKMATKLKRECDALTGPLRDAPGVDDTCRKAQRIVRRWPSERAIEARYHTFPAPWEFGAWLLASIEQRIITFGILAYLLSALIPVLFAPPLQGLRNRYARRKINTLDPRGAGAPVDMDDEIAEAVAAAGGVHDY